MSDAPKPPPPVFEERDPAPYALLAVAVGLLIVGLAFLVSAFFAPLRAGEIYAADGECEDGMSWHWQCRGEWVDETADVELVAVCLELDATGGCPNTFAGDYNRYWRADPGEDDLVLYCPTEATGGRSGCPETARFVRWAELRGDPSTPRGEVTFEPSVDAWLVAVDGRVADYPSEGDAQVAAAGEKLDCPACDVSYSRAYRVDARWRELPAPTPVPPGPTPVPPGPTDPPAPAPGGELRFEDVTHRLEGACLSAAPFGFLIAPWGGAPHVFSFSHQRRSHCAWRADGRALMLDETLSDTLSTVPRPVGCCGWSVQALDMDGDGDLDLTGRTTEGEDGWWRSEGGQPTWVPAPWGHRDTVFFADWEGDGDLDAVSTRQRLVYEVATQRVVDQTDARHVFDADGDGQPDAVDLPLPCPVATTVYLDFEPDGDTDALCVDGDEDAVYGARNDGRGNFARLSGADLGGLTYSGTDRPTKAAHALGDIDNDGRVDVIFGGDDVEGHVYLNLGGGRFAQHRWSELGLSRVRCTDPDTGRWRCNHRPTVALDDLDGDCDLDLVTFAVPGREKANLTLWENHVGGRCLRVPVAPGERVTVRHEGRIVVSHEHVARTGLQQVPGVVHVGLGALDPAALDVEVR